MKFAYIDESGSTDEGDVFVMTGLLVDAYSLRKTTAIFDKMITDFLKLHPSAPSELKTKPFINGKNGWNQIDAVERKKFLKNICELAVEYSCIYTIAISFSKFQQNAGDSLPFKKSYWLAASMFISGLIQKKMQKEQRNKGNTVLVFDDNKKEMPKLSDALYTSDEWYDGLYQVQTTKRGKTVWEPRNPTDRFDQIINTAFAIKSQHSSLVQVADAVAYVYRRYLELQSSSENWQGEKDYYSELVAILNPRKENIGRVPSAECVTFYKNITHTNWTL